MKLFKNLTGFLFTFQWQPLKHRKVKHFGYEFVYGENSAKKNEGIRDIPSICDGLWNRITNKGWTLPWIPDQLTVNCYEPGQGYIFVSYYLKFLN